MIFGYLKGSRIQCMLNLFGKLLELIRIYDCAVVEYTIVLPVEGTASGRLPLLLGYMITLPGLLELL